MIKIRGIVKLAHGIRLKLQNGIPKGEVESFQYLVRRNVGVIEDICRQAKTTPKSLPFSSRQAYLFLKGLDLDCLPLRRNVEAAAGRNGLNPQGRHYDLGALFEKVNSERFRGEMQRPALTWNRTFTSSKFGHYHPARDLVMLSMTLDDARVPSFVVEFVLYHEVLHKKLGVRWNGTTRRVHTQEFRQEERKFPRYKEAEAWLTRLAIDIRKGKSSPY